MNNRRFESLKTAALFGLIFCLALPVAARAQGLSATPHPPASTVAPPGSAPPAMAPNASYSGTSPTTSGISDYVLGVGDKLQITVFGEDDLSGEFQVSSTGTISMPLIGEVPAAGLTSTQVQSNIVNKLADGYMKDPHISLQVSTYRPFFIVGEVMKPGSYTYENGMTVINAVALAGGYTYRADKEDIKLKHGGTQGGQEQKVEENTPVLPGDVVTIPERFF
jgi:protein involved in polysaccharide export with SLBB domain